MATTRHFRDDGTDADLLVATRSGSIPAREALFRRYVRIANGMAFRLVGGFGGHEQVARRALDEVFARIEHPIPIRSLRPTVARSVVRAAHAALRAPHRRARWPFARRPSSWFDDVLNALQPPDAAAELAALYTRADRLPLALRTALLLSHVEGLSPDEIAWAMETRAGVVARWLTRAQGRAGITRRAKLTAAD
jgi:DNA-directed RNA polymerase specialized sigma24 family protein